MNVVINYRFINQVSIFQIYRLLTTANVFIDLRFYLKLWLINPSDSFVGRLGCRASCMTGVWDRTNSPCKGWQRENEKLLWELKKIVYNRGLINTNRPSVSINHLPSKSLWEVFLMYCLHGLLLSPIANVHETMSV